ncbi:hypothetical protein FQN54_008909 [Arachnomyces sp. PD_36]|nr:hypothetical protein FQN54_008909 [Arachnomyces sp. PD_36]
MGTMDFELDPPNGITGFPLGTPAETVWAAAAAKFGEVREVRGQDDDGSDHLEKLLAVHAQFEIVFHIEDGKTLTAVELWFPRPGPEEITVHFRGIDIFRTPVSELLKQLKEMGLTVEDEMDNAFVPQLSLGFTRDADDDIPEDTDGEPLYYKAVLTGPADYYDDILELEDEDEDEPIPKA